jgi:hypothetical protein
MGTPDRKRAAAAEAAVEAAVEAAARRNSNVVLKAGNKETQNSEAFQAVKFGEPGPPQNDESKNGYRICLQDFVSLSFLDI